MISTYMCFHNKLVYLGSTERVLQRGVPYTFNCTKYIANFYYLKTFVQSYMVTSLLFMLNNFTQLIPEKKIFNLYILNICLCIMENTTWFFKTLNSKNWMF